MKITHVIHSSAFGGGPNMLTVLVRELHGQFDMDVVTDGAGDMPARLAELGVKTHRMALTTKWSFATHIPALASLIRSLRPDLVHLHGQFAGSFGQLALGLAGRPRSVYTAQWPSFLDDGGAWSRLRNATAERVSCRATEVVAVSEHDRREFVARGLCAAERIRVIPNAYLVDASALPARDTNPTSPVIGFVGRLVDQKGCEHLVRAAPAILARHPHARFVIVGDGVDRSGLEALAVQEGVAAAFEFAGYDPDPARRLRSMTVLAVPSIYEPLGMVALEAMVCEVPVVASRVGGLPEVVDDGRTGLLVPPRDPAALAAALGRVLDDPASARAMGTAGRDRAIRNFSPEVVAAQYAELYRRLLAATSS